MHALSPTVRTARALHALVVAGDDAPGAGAPPRSIEIASVPPSAWTGISKESDHSLSFGTSVAQGVSVDDVSAKLPVKRAAHAGTSGASGVARSSPHAAIANRSTIARLIA